MRSGGYFCATSRKDVEMIDPSFWVALLALAASIIFGVIGATRNNSVDVKSEIEEAKKEAASSARIETALNSIKSDTRDIKSEQKGVRLDMNEMSRRLTKVEESLKSAWVRIDEIRGISKKDEPGE
jgi:DNA repair ATPase RecN